eukprot:15430237-Alexandrium_andersonii.AAC.1
MRAATRRFGVTFSGEAVAVIHPQSDVYRPMVLIRGDNTVRSDVERCVGEGEALRLGREQYEILEAMSYRP